MSSLGEASGPRPSRLGRYELITQIGQGGMAEVQLALQRGPAGFEKLVVVKLVHEKLAAEKSFVDMLLEEARMAAMLKHPNIVDIYDLGQAEGRYFIAMEYLEGEPLLSVLRAGREGKRLDPLSTGRLIADAAEGLDAAHELHTFGGEALELVHHDVSLGNIVVLYNGQVKLVDFGVAKATQKAGPHTKVQGKFSYMAPEKLRGSSGDRRSDIWSLGCVAWEAMTLRRLFKGGNDTDTMKQVLETKILRPSEVNGDVPADFDPIIMKALERDPSGRYATAKELANDLEDVLREHKYGGKNDLIARYMQATFEKHIVARKKLLQEVASKGRASADILEAAFNETASPMSIHSGEFSVKFSRPTGEIQAVALPITPDEANRPRTPTGIIYAASEASRPHRVTGTHLSAPSTPSPDGSRAHRVTSPPLTPVLRPTQKINRPSGSYLSQSGAEEVVPSGGGTTRNKAPADNKKVYLLAGAGASVLLIVIAIVIRLSMGGIGDTPKPDDRGPEPHGSAGTGHGSGSAVQAGGGSGSADVPSMGSGSATPPSEGSGSAVPSNVEAGSAAAGSGADAGSAAAGAGSDAGSAAGAGSDVDVAAGSGAGDRAGSAHAVADTPPDKPRGPSAQELFKTGMQAYVAGDNRAAVSAFRRAVQQQPSYATAWRALGLAHERLGEAGQAKTALQRYLQLAPTAADAPQIRDKLKAL